MSAKQAEAVSTWLDARGLSVGLYGRDDVVFVSVPVPGRKTGVRVSVKRACWMAYRASKAVG